MHTIEFEGVTYKFDLIDLDSEKDWAAWARQQAMNEAEEYSRDWPAELRVAFLAKVSTEASLAKCAITTEFGITNLGTREGVAKILELASRKHHRAPHVPYEVMERLVSAREADAARTALLVIPISEEARRQVLENLEKKLSGRKDGQPPATSKSAALSGESPGVSTPIRLAE